MGLGADNKNDRNSMTCRFIVRAQHAHLLRHRFDTALRRKKHMRGRDAYHRGHYSKNVFIVHGSACRCRLAPYRGFSLKNTVWVGCHFHCTKRASAQVERYRWQDEHGRHTRTRNVLPCAHLASSSLHWVGWRSPHCFRCCVIVLRRRSAVSKSCRALIDISGTTSDYTLCANSSCAWAWNGTF